MNDAHKTSDSSNSSSSPSGGGRRSSIARRHFFRDCGYGVGKIALASLLLPLGGLAGRNSARAATSPASASTSTCA